MKEDIEVKAHTAKLKPGQRDNKQRAEQPDNKQATELQQTHATSPAAIANARCQPCR